MNNKETVMLYMEGFREGNHVKILSCLTDDVIWEMPGFFLLKGKEEFDREIENDAFEGKPDISVIRLVEENNIVVAEGAVRGNYKNGDVMEALFCDVFRFEKGKIKQLTTYLMQINH